MRTKLTRTAMRCDDRFKGGGGLKLFPTAGKTHKASTSSQKLSFISQKKKADGLAS